MNWSNKTNTEWICCGRTTWKAHYVDRLSWKRWKIFSITTIMTKKKSIERNALLFIDLIGRCGMNRFAIGKYNEIFISISRCQRNRILCCTTSNMNCLQFFFVCFDSCHIFWAISSAILHLFRWTIMCAFLRVIHFFMSCEMLLFFNETKRELTRQVNER